MTTEQEKVYRRNRRHLLKTNEPPVKQPTFSGLEEKIPSTVTKPESEPKPTVLSSTMDLSNFVLDLSLVLFWTCH